MKESLRTGISFGLTSGVITTLGLMVGLHAGTHSRMVVIGGIVTIAISDACSDALGIHVSEEAENVHTERQIWAATIATFLTKFLFALTFLVPLLTCPLKCAIVTSIAWGFFVLALFSYLMAREQNQKPIFVIGEHLLIALAVITITHFVGIWVAGFAA